MENSCRVGRAKCDVRRPLFILSFYCYDISVKRRRTDGRMARPGVVVGRCLRDCTSLKWEEGSGTDRTVRRGHTKRKKKTLNQPNDTRRSIVAPKEKKRKRKT